MRTNTPALTLFIAFLLVACDSAPPPEKKVETPVRPAKLIQVGQENNTNLSISVENFPPVSVQKFPHGLVG